MSRNGSMAITLIPSCFAASIWRTRFSFCLAFQDLRDATWPSASTPFTCGTPASTTIVVDGVTDSATVPPIRSTSISSRFLSLSGSAPNCVSPTITTSSGVPGDQRLVATTSPGMIGSRTESCRTRQRTSESLSIATTSTTAFLLPICGCGSVGL